MGKRIDEGSGANLGEGVGKEGKRLSNINKKNIGVSKILSKIGRVVCLLYLNKRK